VTETDRPGTPDLVWYASYGSNLCAERFRCYVAGGIPPGLTRPCRGARDTRPPREDRPLDIDHRLYFAGFAEPWGGAPCFVDTVESPDTPTHARAYLITWEQFEDVVAQENGRPTSRIDLDRGDLGAGFGIRLGSGRYENLLCFGRRDDGFPVMTITSPWTMSDAQLAAPSPAYLKVMITGLRQSHGMSDDAIVAYLAAAPGCSEQLVVSAFAPAEESEG
jgi:hypothetical protein